MGAGELRPLSMHHHPPGSIGKGERSLFRYERCIPHNYLFNDEHMEIHSSVPGCISWHRVGFDLEFHLCLGKWNAYSKVAESKFKDVLADKTKKE